MSNELTKQGWLKRITIDKSRLNEIVEEYKLLGFEVHLEPVTLEDFDEECGNCFQNQIEKFKTVYVRKRK